MIKNFFSIVLISILLSGCSAYPEFDSCQYQNQKWQGLAVNDQNIGAILNVQIVSCPDSRIFPKDVNLELYIHNRSASPIQTNIFADKLQLVTKDKVTYALDLANNTNQAGEIINPNSAGLYKLGDNSSSIFNLFINDQIALINFYLGFNQKTIMLLRTPEEESTS